MHCLPGCLHPQSLSAQPEASRSHAWLFSQQCPTVPCSPSGPARPQPQCSFPPPASGSAPSAASAPARWRPNAQRGRRAGRWHPQSLDWQWGQAVTPYCTPRAPSRSMSVRGHRCWDMNMSRLPHCPLGLCPKQATGPEDSGESGPPQGTPPQPSDFLFFGPGKWSPKRAR